MAATIEQIMTGLKTRLATIPGLQALDFAADNPTPPTAFPLVPAFDYRQTMRRGSYTLPFRIAVLTGAQLDREGQMNLAGYANQTGATSVRAAIEADNTLGGIVSETVVDDFDPQGLESVGLTQYYGGIFNVRVIASGV